MIGRLGEEVAKNYLQLMGLQFLEQNRRSGPLELDLLFREGRELVIVEVKTYCSKSSSEIGQKLLPRQRAHLIRAARRGLKDYPWASEIRLDVIAIEYGEQGLQLRHLPSAFYFF